MRRKHVTKPLTDSFQPSRKNKEQDLQDFNLENLAAKIKIDRNLEGSGRSANYNKTQD